MAPMARKRPADRLEVLVSTATRVFIHKGGFRRTQIGDVAKAMGVAKGTLYLYVESKEALFDLVLRRADRPGQPDPALPLPTPASGATLTYFAERLDEETRFPALTAAEATDAPEDARAELDAILGELYAVFRTNGTAIKLIASSAHDLPDFAELWYQRARGATNGRLAAHLERRSASGHLPPVPDALAAARLMTEVATWFAVHRHWDPQPDAIDDAVAEATVRSLLLRALGPAA